MNDDNNNYCFKKYFQIYGLVYGPDKTKHDTVLALFGNIICAAVG